MKPGPGVITSYVAFSFFRSSSARLKFSVLNGTTSEASVENKAPGAMSPFGAQSTGQLFKLGLALTWPLAAVAFLAFAVLLILLFSRG